MSKNLPRFLWVWVCLCMAQSAMGQYLCPSPHPTAAQEAQNAETIFQIKKRLTNSRLEATISYIPIKVHIVRQSNGSGGPSIQALNSALATVNAQYIDTDIQYYFCEAQPHYIDNSTFYNYNLNQESALCDGNDVNNAVNLYITNDIAQTGGVTGVTGYAYFPSGNRIYNRIFLKSAFVDDNRTLSHELGHYHSLYHTFQYNNDPASTGRRELVTRDAPLSRCESRGDLLCDTPADPYGLAGATVSGCVYTGSVRDSLGALFTPSLSNIMSYYSNCGNTLTAGQHGRIRDGWLLRQSLINGGGNYTLNCPPTVLTAPSGLTAANQGNGVLLNWNDNSSNEAGFIIERSTSASGGFVAIAGVVPNVRSFTDNTVLSNTTYFYRIKASNTTDNYSNVASVTTGLNYCQSNLYTFLCDQSDVIADFILASGTTNLISNINTNCSPNNFGDYTATPATVVAGNPYNVTVRLVTGGVGSYVPQHIAIWIDLNRDGTFAASEMVFQTNASTPENPTIRATFTIPASTTAGITRMRVRSQIKDPDLFTGGIVDSPCAKYDVGEVEDYALNISTSGGGGSSPTITTGTVTPNTICVGSSISVPFTNTGTFGTGNTFTVQLSDAAGNNFTNIPTTGTASPLSAQIPGTTGAGSGYRVRVVSSNATTTGSSSGTFTINTLPTALANSNTPVCVGSPLNLSASGGTTYAWAGAGGYTANTQNPTIANVTNSQSGIYSVTVANAGGCSATASTSVVVQVAPAASANSNSPICGGSTLNLMGNAGMTGYTWAGPNNFGSTQISPSIGNVNNTNAGLYTLTITNGGCSASATVSVTIGAANAQVGSNSPVCIGQPLTLTASGGTNYAWTGVGGFSASGASVSRNIASTADAGLYQVIIGSASCTSTLTVSVQVRALPTAALTGTQTVTQGNAANLSVTFSGTGPFSFSLSNGIAVNNTNNNPHIVSVLPNATTTYTVASVSNACGTGSASGSATVTVNNSQGATNSITTSSPNFGANVCTETPFTLPYSSDGNFNPGNVFRLEVSDANGGNFSPLPTSQNGGSLSATMPLLAQSSGYRLRIVATDPLTISNSTGTFTVNVRPQATAFVSSPVCVGNSTALSATGGTGYQWSNALGNFSSSQQSPVINNTQFSNIGDYSVVVSGQGGCTASASVNLDVVANNATASIQSNSPQNVGQTLNLTGSGGSSYTWAGPNGFSAAVVAPSISSVSSAAAGVYSLTSRTSNNCSATATANIAIITPVSTCITLSLKSILEGPYLSNTGLMRTTLYTSGLLPGQTPTNQSFTPTPAGQPYNTTPWNYTGTEAFTSYPTNTVDWILVSLRTNNSSVSSTVKSLAGLLLSDGSMVFPQESCVNLPTNQSYFVVVEHRNHIGVMSEVAIAVQNNTIAYDFTAQDSYKITNPPSFGQKQLNNGKWAMMAGDGRKNTTANNYEVNANDILIWRTDAGSFGKYHQGDFDLNADLNATDNFLWRNNSGKYSKVPK